MSENHPSNTPIFCAYCGHRYWPDAQVQATMADVVKKHVERCPEYLREFLAKLIQAVRIIRREPRGSFDYIDACRATDALLASPDLAALVKETP